MDNSLGIVGYGIVGQPLEYGFKKDPIFIYDKYKDFLSLEEVCKKAEFIFLAVPTPMTADYTGIDLTIVEESVSEIAKRISGTDKILVIKSSVIPGTTASLAKKYPEIKIAFNPNF